ncbi:MAG: TIGR00268 family protein [Flavonifractor plautii]
MTLNEFFAAHPKCALGFSGGVDSAYLLYAGVQAGADIRPYYIKTAFQPRFERDDALRLAGELGVEVTVLELDALADPRVAANPAERCYYCKQNLFRALKARAAADGYTVLLDGTNASDEAGDRPGMRALRELEVRSPLRECGLTKADIRRLSREAGLFTWDKPAYACLATRIPTGEAITGEILARVEGAEDALFRLGTLTSGCGCSTGRHGSSFRPDSWSGPSGSGPSCGRPWPPISSRFCWIWRSAEWNRERSKPCWSRWPPDRWM